MSSTKNKLMLSAVSRSSADDSIKKNASSASGVGLEVRVTRRYDYIGVHDRKDDCEWCLSRCGENMTLQEAYKKGAFQRHDGCSCIIEYTSNKGIKTIQTGKYKGWNFNDELEKRKSIGLDEQIYADEIFSRFEPYIENSPEELYETAKNGGTNFGLYLQSHEKPKPELEQSIKKHLREVEDHEWKIHHPEMGMKREDPNDPVERKRAINTWANHRKRNAEQGTIELEIWRRLYGEKH